MGSSRTITLFYECPEVDRRPDSFVFSMLVHGVVCGVLSFGIMDAAAIKDPVMTDRYVMRRLELRQAQPGLRRSSDSRNDYPQWRPGPYVHSASAKATSPPVQLPRLKTGPQTVVQPDLRSDLTLAQEIPIPKVVIWRPARTPALAIVPPPSQKRAAADAAPSLDLPNEEEHLAELRVSPASLSVHPQAMLPSTTTPLTVRAPEGLQSAPLTTSQRSSDPAPAAVMTLSEIYMPEGTVTLPPVNESAPAPSSGPASKEQGNGEAVQAGDFGKPVAAMGSDKKADSGFGAAEGLSTERITLPKDGQFGAVVVGASLEEQYPEIGELWTDRLAYTVYLHVGLSKSWILQYSLPPSEDAKSAGTMSRIDPPWPYVIVRPNIPSGGINGDALMIHGYVNETGGFEGLAVVFPQEFRLGRYVLDALQQWHFRPAIHAGQPAKAEVLLIIPEVE